nr:protein accelerated cell death 6 isoform X1 [Tanacetum cinerariifolium]
MKYQSSLSSLPCTKCYYFQQKWYQGQVLLNNWAFESPKMAASSNSAVPTFKGDSYEFWSIKMKTLFISQDLSEYVESGYAESEKPTMTTLVTRKIKNVMRRLFFIQQAVDERFFFKNSSKYYLKTGVVNP